MLKGRRKTKDLDAAEVTVAVEDAAETETNEERAAMASEPAVREKGDFVAVRPWSQRMVQPVAYTRFTDANIQLANTVERGIIAFKFDLPRGQYQPDQEILDLLNANKKDYRGDPSGLQLTQTRQHGKIWAMPNDREGRALADKIEMALKDLAKQKESPDQGRF